MQFGQQFFLSPPPNRLASNANVLPQAKITELDVLIRQTTRAIATDALMSQSFSGEEKRGGFPDADHRDGDSVGVKAGVSISAFGADASGIDASGSSTRVLLRIGS